MPFADELKMPTAAAGHVVVVSTTANGREQGAATARSVLANSCGSARLMLVGDRRALHTILTDSALAGAYQPLEVSGSGGSDANFAAALSASQGRDFIFVAAGIEVPEFWDLRLAWTARRLAGVATVSPLCEGHPELGAGLPADCSGTAALDRLVYTWSQFEAIELQHPLRECLYVSREAARAVLSQAPSGCGMHGFLEITRALRFTHVVADHVCVGNAGVVSRRKARHPSWMLQLNERIRSARPGDEPASPASAARPRQLHILHSWGGGLDRWVREYCRADTAHANFILTSSGTWNAFGMSLWLYRNYEDREPALVSSLDPPIKGTTAAHEKYRSVLTGIVARYGIGRILISSFIGHSMDALDTGIPTMVVCHDYYPFCPALNITFGEVCRECGGARLAACTRENPHNRFFLNMPPAEVLELRRAFFDRILRTGTPMIAPSPSVREHYVQLAPEIAPALYVIPHGTRPVAPTPLRLSFAKDRPLRVVVLGSIAPNKGLRLLEEAAPRLLDFSCLFLVGCGPEGESLGRRRGITVVPRYRWEELPDLLGDLDPDIALLPSCVPETFGYTLEELNQLGIPTLATAIGSFADRIQDGRNGFLCEPAADAIVARLRAIAADRTLLLAIHQTLASVRPRMIAQMIEDYDALVLAPDAGFRAYFCPDSRMKRQPPVPARAQVSWRTREQTYSDARSSSVAFAGKARRQTLRVSLPEGDGAPVELRFQPGEEGGVLLLYSVRVRDALGSTALEWTAEDLTRSGARVIGESATGPGIFLLLEKNSAGLRLPIPDGVRPSAFEAEYTLLHPSELPAEWNEPPGLSEECDRLVVGIEESAADKPDASQASAECLRRELAEARHRITAIENSLSWRITGPLRVLGGIAMSHARRPPGRPEKRHRTGRNPK